VEDASSTKESGAVPVKSSISAYDQWQGGNGIVPIAGSKPSGFASPETTMSILNRLKKPSPTPKIFTHGAPINTNTPNNLAYASCIPTTTTVYVYVTAATQHSKRHLEKRDLGGFDYTSPSKPTVTSTTHTKTISTTVTPAPSGTTTTTNWVYATTTKIITPLPSGTTTTTLPPSGTYTAWTTTTLAAAISTYTHLKVATTSTTATPKWGVKTLTVYDTSTTHAILTYTTTASEVHVTTIKGCYPPLGTGGYAVPSGAYDDPSIPSGVLPPISSSSSSSSSSPAVVSSSAAAT
jgi:hypothetical protein